MKILLVYPECPDTFHWEKRLVDINASKLKDNNPIWADYPFCPRNGSPEVFRMRPTCDSRDLHEGQQDGPDSECFTF